MENERCRGLIDPRLVQTIFSEVLLKDHEVDGVACEGPTMVVKLHSGRLMQHKDAVVAALGKLPRGFRSVEGGLSFLCSCQDRDGAFWTSAIERREELFLMGLGLGVVRCLYPKEKWAGLPGKVPYYEVLE